MIPFSCPVCGEPVELSDDWDYTIVACPHCGRTTNLMAASDAAELRPGDRLGHFELIKLLGSGGNGTVWRAHDHDLDRDVAIKFPSRDIIEPKDRVRFLREASLAARVKHPHILPIYHVGEGKLERRHADGRSEELASRLYIISELVDGVGLDRYLKSGKRPTPAKAARLIERIADALGAAHQATIIHRDVKPSNIMLDRAGLPVLLDFGVSKSSDTEHRTISLEGAVIGSLFYLSPEQARAENSSLDIRTDLYSLGVVFFELLTGRRPFEGTEKEVEHAVADPTRDAPSPRQFDRSVPRDLETICRKCLEKNRELRFASGRELADELRRFREGIPIRSRPISRVGRFARWCRRRPLIATLAAMVFVVSATGVGIVWNLSSHAEKTERQLTQDKQSLDRRLTRTKTELDSKSAALSQQTQIATIKSREAELKTEEAQRQKREAYLNRYVADMRQARELWAIRDLGELKRLLERHLPWRANEDDARGFEWYYWWRLAQGNAEEPEATSNDVVIHDLYAAALSHDGSLLATGHRDRGVVLSELPSGSLIAQVENGAGISAIAMSSDGEWIAGASVDKPYVIRIWNRKGRVVATLPGLRWHPIRMVFSPDGRRLASSGADYEQGNRVGEVVIWDVESQEPLEVLRDPRTAHFTQLKRVDPLTQANTEAFCFGPDGQSLISAGGRTTTSQGTQEHLLVDWDATSGNLRRLPKTMKQLTNALVVSEDGQRLWTGTGREIFEWSLSTPDPEASKSVIKKLNIEIPSNELGLVRALAAPCAGLMSVSPDHRRLVTTSRSDEIVVLDLQTGQTLQTFQGHSERILSVQIDDKERLLSIDQVGQIKEWKVGGAATGERTLSFGHELDRSKPRRAIRDFRFSGNQLVAVYQSPKGLMVWNEATNEEIPVSIKTVQIEHFWLSGDGQRLILHGLDLIERKNKVTRVWDIKSNQEVVGRDAEDEAAAVSIPTIGHLQTQAISADGKRLLELAPGKDRIFRIKELPAGRVLCTLKRASQLRGPTFSQDGSRLYALPNQQAAVVTVWDCASGEILSELHAQGAVYSKTALSPDGRRMAIGGEDVKVSDSSDLRSGGVRIIDTVTKQEVLALTTGFRVDRLAFSSDGSQLAGGADYGNVVLWKSIPGPRKP